MTGFWHASVLAGWRRKGWFLENPSPRKVANLCLASLEFLLRREYMRSLPLMVKIDISPLCNIHCTVCVHARPDGVDYLEKQDFRATQKMSLESYRRIIEQIKGRSMAVSLYYFGDPLVHPDLDEMCRIARGAKLNVHVSSNFSFKLTDERVQSLLQSGLTHLTVCVDGLSQEKYERTRVGGRIEWVLSNLERICRYRHEARLRYPKVEVQYIAFDHNRDELNTALRLFKEMKVDAVEVLEGTTTNWARPVPDAASVRGPKKAKWLPQCEWPHLFMLVKYNGDVIPCCKYRIGEQYSRTDDSRAVGNLEKTSLREIWNSAPYRQMRRLVAHPAKGASEEGAVESFCHGCGRVYEIEADVAKPVSPAVAHAAEAPA